MITSQLALQGYEQYYFMLTDKVRMDAYHKAIFQTVKKGDIVVDLGAGTGILGFWALKAGAEKVYLIEKTETIELAKELAKVNGLQEKVIFINENSLDVELPEKADVIISETLGSFGLDENTLLFINDAKQRFLADNGVLIPESLELFVSPINCPEVYNKIGFWKNIPDLNFDPAFELFSSKLLVESVNYDDLLANPINYGKINFYTENNPVFSNRQYIAIDKPGLIYGVAGWFNLKLCDGVEINTSPTHAETHWKQAFFPFKMPIQVIKGDVLDWNMIIGGKEKASDHTHISFNYRCTQLKNEPNYKVDYSNIKRNDLCPCGSGKKYKNCCLA